MATTNLTHRRRWRLFRSPVGPADLAILQAVQRYGYLTARQVQRLRYAAGTTSYVQMKLKLLCEQGLLARFYPPRAGRAGSSPAVYRLATRGRRLLRRAGLGERRIARSVAGEAHSFLFLAHSLAVTDLLIAAELLARSERRVHLAGVLTERELRQDPVRVCLPDGSTTSVIPDGWIDMRLDGRRQLAIALEVDRGTTDQARWRRKVSSLLAWADGPYQRRFGTPSLTIAVVATPGSERRERLLRWTEVELQRRRRIEDADLFRFASLAAGDEVGLALWRDACWWRPFSVATLSLVPTAEEEQR